MTRPRLCRKVRYKPIAKYFKPQGIPLRSLQSVTLTHEEAEALRLKDMQQMDQNKAAERMNTSQSTFQRILTQARKKVSSAIIEGKAIEIID